MLKSGESNEGFTISSRYLVWPTEIDYESQKNQNPPRMPDTCQWTLRNPKYLTWRDDKMKKLLWISVDPGCEKSVTWSKNKDLDLFWPSKFLPLESDICEARIMTFGYNGSFLRANTRNSATVLDFAKDLLYDLKYAEDEDRHDLPIGDGNRCH